MERGKHNKRADISLCAVYRSKEPTASVELEGGVTGVDADRDWTNGNGRLLQVRLTALLDILVRRLSGAHVRDLEVAPTILKSNQVSHWVI